MRGRPAVEEAHLSAAERAIRVPELELLVVPVGPPPLVAVAPLGYDALVAEGLEDLGQVVHLVPGIPLSAQDDVSSLECGMSAETVEEAVQEQLALAAGCGSVFSRS